MENAKIIVYLFKLIKLSFEDSLAHSKREFEILVNAPENNKFFHNLVNQLIEEGCLYIHDTLPNGYPLFKINSDKLRDKLRTIEDYNTIWYVFNKTSVFGAKH